jgi:hypothetical protein
MLSQFPHPDLVAMQVYLVQQDIIASFLDYHLQGLPEFEGTPHRGNMDEIRISNPAAENPGRTLWMYPLNFLEENIFCLSYRPYPRFELCSLSLRQGTDHA